MQKHITTIPSPFLPSISEALIVEPGDGRWLMVSGQVGVNLKGRDPDQSFQDEVETCFDRIADTLARASSSLADIVKLTAFLVEADEYGVYAAVRKERFGVQAPPASSSVFVKGLLLGARIEIEAVAYQVRS